jgi:hypothetical protein
MGMILSRAWATLVSLFVSLMLMTPPLPTFRHMLLTTPHFPFLFLS